MVNENLINNKKPVELVQELEKYEIKKSPLSKVARAKVINKSGSNYVSEDKEDYGSCGDDNDCDCSCRRKSDCNRLIHYEMYGEGSSKGSLKYKLASDGVELKEKISASIRCKKTDYDETNYFNVSAGGSIGLNSEGVNLGAKAGIDLVKYENENGFEARAGLNVDTGGTVGKDGVGVKFLGFGVSVGKKNGISTPFGEISKSSDDCVIQ